MTPSQEFHPRFKLTSFESCPRLSGMVPFISFAERENSCKDDKLPIEDGIEPPNRVEIEIEVGQASKPPQ